MPFPLRTHMASHHEKSSSTSVSSEVRHCVVLPDSGVRRKFSWGVLVLGHMVVICFWYALFVTSQFDVISMFPNQRFGEVC